MQSLGKEVTTSNALVRSSAWLALVAGLATLIVYGRVSTLGAVWDDKALVVDNPYFGTLGGLARLVSTDIWTASATGDKSEFYRPVTMATYFLDHTLWAKGPGAYHMTDAVLHGLNGLLLGTFLLASGVRRVTTASVATAMFLVWPINVEAVCWISGRFDLLGLTFLLVAFHLQKHERPAFAFAAVGAFALACLTKEAFVIGLPLLMLHGLLLTRHGARRVGLTVAGCLIALIGTLALRHTAGVFTSRAFSETPPASLIASYTQLLATYPRLAFVPTYLDPFRPYAPMPPGVIALVLVVAVSVVSFLAFVCLRHPNDPRMRLGLFGILWLFLGFVPVSVTGPNLLMFGDRYAYFPCVGLVALVAALSDMATDRLANLANGHRYLGLAFTMASVATVSWATVARRRVPVWENNSTLVSAILADNPHSPYALYWSGYELALASRYDEAEAPLLRSMALEPKAWRTHNALCFVHLNQSRLELAESECRASLAINPQAHRAWTNLATIYVKGRRWREAIDVSGRALAIRPNNVEPRYLRAVSLANVGALDEALREVNLALASEPNHEPSKRLVGDLIHALSQRTP